MNQLTILCCHLLDIGCYYIEAYFSLEKQFYSTFTQDLLCIRLCDVKKKKQPYEAHNVMINNLSS